MDPSPPGLVNRYMYSRHDRRVVIDETWDVSVSGCPMIPIRRVEIYRLRRADRRLRGFHSHAANEIKGG